jgi:hypothetical protein
LSSTTVANVESCPYCGLTFKNGERQFSRFGRPIVTLGDHVADHEAERPYEVLVVTSPGATEEAAALRKEFAGIPASVYPGSASAYDFAAALSASKDRQRIRSKARTLVARVEYDGYANLVAEGAFARDPEDDPREPVPYAVTTPAQLAEWSKTRNAMLKRARFTCQRCNERKPKGELSVHHIVPRSEGGMERSGNLITLCHPCHDFVEIQFPTLRNRAQIVGSQDWNERDTELAEIRETVAEWAGRRKPHDLIRDLAARCEKLGMMSKSIADTLNVSDRLLSEVCRSGWALN